MTKQSNIPAIEKQTGMSWDDWLKFFESINARELNHTQIARKVHESGKAGDWWAQSVTVAYEQHIGRRLPGQRSDGSFEVSVSKTLAGTLNSVIATWVETMSAKPDINKVSIVKGPTVSESEKWRYWRCSLANGSNITVHISKKAEDKVQLAVQHIKLSKQEHLEDWRNYWKEIIQSL